MPIHENEFKQRLALADFRRKLAFIRVIWTVTFLLVIGSVIGIAEIARLKREAKEFEARQRVWIAEHPQLARELGWLEGGAK